MCLFQFWFPQGICLEVGLLGLMVVLFLVKPSVDFLLSRTVIFSYRLSEWFFSHKFTLFDDFLHFTIS